MLAYIPVMFAIAWIIPERLWSRLFRPLVRLKMRFKHHWLDIHGAMILALHGRRSPVDIDALIQTQLVNNQLERLEIFRCYRPGGWRPRLELDGVRHIHEALAAGRGAILWVTPMWHSDLVTKMSLHQAGIAVSHLSRDVHGSFSKSRLGMRFLNPIWTRVERRYLAERLVMDIKGRAGALRTLTRRIRANRIVSIAVGSRGKREYDIPFLTGRMRVAAGAPALAIKTKAALLPVFTIRRADGSFLTRIEAPLSAGTSKKGSEAERELSERYGALATEMATRYPDRIRYIGLRLNVMAPDVAASTSSASKKGHTVNSA